MSKKIGLIAVILLLVTVVGASAETFDTYVNLRINSIKSSMPCEAKIEFRSGVNIPVHVEIRDSTGATLIGGAKDYTDAKLWGAGEVLTTDKVTLETGKSYTFFLDVDQARAYGSIFQDANGLGGYDFGCGIIGNTLNTDYANGLTYQQYYGYSSGSTIACVTVRANPVVWAKSCLFSGAVSSNFDLPRDATYSPYYPQYRRQRADSGADWNTETGGNFLIPFTVS